MGTERKEKLLLMTLDEDITAASVSTIKDEILGQLDEELSEIHLDLTNVEMVDSTGISLLISIQNSLKKNSGSLSVLNVSDDVAHMFKLMRLDKHFKVSAR